MTLFEKDSVYDFTVRGIASCNGTGYFMLQYGNKHTMPEYYSRYKWEFRVPMFPFQEECEADEYIGQSLRCRVKGYNRDEFGEPTEFPLLIQDINALLQGKYHPGESYSFLVHEETGPGLFRVRDALGFTHNVPKGTAVKMGDDVTLRIRDIKDGHLWFESERSNAILKELFQVGEVYNFSVEMEDFDESSSRHFYILRDSKGTEFLHRFYFKEPREDGPGDTIKLQIKDFTTKGYLFLKDTEETAAAPATEETPLLSHLPQAEDSPTEGEGQNVEFKSSFTFSARSGEQDIDHQLDFEIMRQVAGFMNAGGGTVYIGYQDDGTVCGIDRDLPYLNSSNEDEFTYEPTADSIIRKFTNTVARVLGAKACTLVQVELLKKNGFLVCHLHVSPSLGWPIYWKGKRLYVRCQNSVRRMTGDDLTFYICRRCGIATSAAAATPAAPSALPAAPHKPAEKVSDKEIADLAATMKREVVERTDVWRYITLYTNGEVSSRSKQETGADVLLNIPVSKAYKKKSSRLLLCYDNGCVNVLNPADIIKNKLTKTGKRYANGYANSSDCALVRALVCDEDDYLVVRSTNAQGREHIKAVGLQEYKVHKAQSMHTKGNVILKSEFGTATDYQIVTADRQSVIYRILSKKSDRYGAGFAADAPYCQPIMTVLNRKNGEEES